MRRTATLRKGSQDELRRNPIRRSSHSGDSPKLRQGLQPFILTDVVQLGGANPLVPPFGEWGQRVSQESTNCSFDDLARALAELRHNRVLGSSPRIML
jgi:hypothetical protein